jgi:hypothetical protein
MASPIEEGTLMSAPFLSRHVNIVRETMRIVPNKYFFWVMIAGSILVPLLVLLSYIFSFSLIDLAIGPAASRNHGYTFLSLAFYPLLLLVYWPAMWLVDRAMARRKRRHT